MHDYARSGRLTAMKIRIQTADVRVGMFIDAMDGSWWDNPFWTRRFLLATSRDLARLQASGVAWVVIDDERGVGVDVGPPAPVPAAPPPSRPRPVRAAPRLVPVAPRPAPAADFEYQRAAATVERSKVEVMRMFADVRMGKAVKPQAMTTIVDEICDSVGEDATAVLKVTRLKKKNEYTYLHSVAVSALLIALARHLRLGEDLVRELGLAGLLHDIGKMAIPAAILDKPGRLDPGEIDIVRTHPEHGHAMLIEGNVSPIVHDVILHHHEKVDGTGYPHGLSGEALSLYARMSAVCDVYDAVTSKRAYKRQWTPSEALNEMRAWTGHFDPAMLDAFMQCVGIYPIGLLVRLRSNRLAIVRTENLARPTQPIVRAFFLPGEHRFVDPVDIRIGNSLKGDAVVGIEDPARSFGEGWPAIRDAVLAGRRPDAADAALPQVETRERAHG